LKQQLLGFPTGRIDVPNALAYALKLRPGLPIYDSFGARHVFEDLRSVRGATPWLVVNATRSLLAASLVQFRDGTLYVLDDWVREGSPTETIRDVVANAQLSAGGRVTVVAAPHHFESYNNVGLLQACARIPVTTQRGVPSHLGSPALSSLMQRESRGFPSFRVASQARWTLNALAGGYTRGLKNGVLTESAEEGPYKILIEGLESFAGLTDAGSLFDDDSDMTYATTAQGHRYLSAKR